MPLTYILLFRALADFQVIDEGMITFNESLPLDQVSYTADIQASMAYVKALTCSGLLAPDELFSINAGFQSIKEWDYKTFVIQPAVDETSTQPSSAIPVT